MPKDQPKIETERLILRPFTLADAPTVRRLAGEREIAATTLSIPHPYEDGMAERWIGCHQRDFEKGEAANFAIVLREDDVLVGAIGLHLTLAHLRAEIGYWIGRPHWNHGYATEAARAVLRYGFEAFGLNRIEAHHFRSNPTSGRVMQKLGMQHEGRLREGIQKWGVFEDIELYSILRCDFDRQKGEPRGGEQGK